AKVGSIRVARISQALSTRPEHRSVSSRPPRPESTRPKAIDLVSETLLRCGLDSGEVRLRLLFERKHDDGDANQRPDQSRQPTFYAHVSAGPQRIARERKYA